MTISYWTIVEISVISRSDDAAISTDHLAADPAAVGTGEEGHEAADILRLAKVAERVHADKSLHYHIALAGHEQFRFYRHRRHRVDGDAPRAQFFDEYMGHGLDCSRGGRVIAVSVLVYANQA